ncbi:MAG: DUF5668 domain-containing protein [Candidatus Margulisiibacteriota bacterium]|jgi:hypothetical protein
MKAKNVFWGLFLLCFGLLLLGNNLDVVAVDWVFLLHFWPLIFIYWGCAMLLGNTPSARVLLTLLSIVIFGGLLYLALTHQMSAYDYLKISMRGFA